MRNPYPATRKSHCIICGNRLSSRTATGRIAWQPSHIDDKGIYCSACAATRKPSHESAGERNGTCP